MQNPSEEEVSNAVAVIKAHLDHEWISEGCETEHAFGCISCHAVFVKRQLEALDAFLGECIASPPKEKDDER